jgi:uncharacterized damage-inducible protein DinB
MTLSDMLLRELESEAKITRRVLERVPSSKLAWKPHERSMSLGRLAQHVASTPGSIAASSVPDSFAVENFTPDPEPGSTEEILKVHEASMAAAKSVLASLDEARAMASWTMTAGGKPMLTMTRLDWIRTIMLNHWIHHRGQLSVYLRELNVPVPAMYGPSADEAE